MIEALAKAATLTIARTLFGISSTTPPEVVTKPATLSGIVAPPIATSRVTTEANAS